MLDAPACSPSAGAERAGDLQRRITIVLDLAAQLETAVAQIPQPRPVDAWWGPAREAVQVAFDRERERLRRESLRLRGVADQLRIAEMAARQPSPTAVVTGVWP